MREIWLDTNRRALYFGMLAPLLSIGIGALFVWQLSASDLSGLKWLGVGMVVVGSCLVIVLIAQTRRPRVTYEDGQVLFNLRNGPPIAVPVEHVEAFFIGQGPVMIPGAPQHDVSVNLVARISQRDPSYAQREVKQALGAWCDSYVTIRGTWCEPLNGELVRRINHRLREVSEARERSKSAS
jgi:hypothetical protein